MPGPEALIIWVYELSNNFINFLILIAYFSSFSSNLSAQTIIQKILFNGLERTSIEHLDQYLKCSVGDTLDLSVLEDDETFLRNSQYFSNASHSISIENNHATVTFNVSEKRSLLPIQKQFRKETKRSSK